ncbi:Transcriptional regulator, TetR family [hydrothermal vent metagenome]|uniref:Transcriptional regulator, TetR family n=1 Tax=hydrothermal vent metagenome TaxID=652676 RepID=A0A1W1B9S1_9ZZZZ
MAKNRRDAEATRSKILSSAMALFAQKGFDAVTVDEIGAECGVNKAMIFYYFKSKSGLYEAIMKSVFDDIYIKIVEAEKCCNDVVGELKAFVEAYTLYATKYPHFPALLLREISNGGAQIPELMFESMKKLFMLLSDILKRGEEQGIFKDVISMVVHFMILGSVNLYIVSTPLRKRVDEDGIDTCCGCDTKMIAEYIFKKITLMLEVDSEKISSCS